MKRPKSQNILRLKMFSGIEGLYFCFNRDYLFIVIKMNMLKFSSKTNTKFHCK